MPEDASLDEFLDAGDSGSDADSETDADTEASETDAADAGETPADDAPGDTTDDEPSSDPEPATPTYASTPDSDPCAACGEAVTERWRDDGAWVCADCKEW